MTSLKIQNVGKSNSFILRSSNLDRTGYGQIIFHVLNLMVRFYNN